MSIDYFSAFIKGINELIWDVTRGNKKQFAAEVGVNYDTVRCWCSGKYLPGGETLVMLHHKYNVSIDKLLLGVDAAHAFKETLPPELQHACAQVSKILQSGNSETALALIANINALAHAAEKEIEKNKLEDDLNKLKAVVRELRKQDEAKTQTIIEMKTKE